MVTTRYYPQTWTTKEFLLIIYGSPPEIRNRYLSNARLQLYYYIYLLRSKFLCDISRDACVLNSLAPPSSPRSIWSVVVYG